MTPRDAFGHSLRRALTARDRARRGWLTSKPAADAEFTTDVMAAADSYAQACVAAVTEAALRPVTSNDQETT